MILQLKFQQSFVVSVDVPQIPFIDRVADISVASQRLVPQCLLCRRPEIPCCSSGVVVDMPLVCQRQGYGSDSTENCGVLQVQYSDGRCLLQFIDGLDVPVNMQRRCLATGGAQIQFIAGVSAHSSYRDEYAFSVGGGANWPVATC